LEISDRVALLTHGKLRFVGTPAEFRASNDPVVRAFADRQAAAQAAIQLVERDDRDEENEEGTGAPTSRFRRRRRRAAAIARSGWACSWCSACSPRSWSSP